MSVWTGLRPSLGIGVLALLLASCASAPPQRTQPPLPAAWFGPAGTAPDGADAARLAQWWHQFDDPQMHALVDAALSRNLDVQGALAELRLARAQLRGASAALWPVLDGSGQASRQWLDLGDALDGEDNPLGDLLGGEGNTELDSWQLALQASWELDLFGANRLRRKAGALRLGAAQAQLVAARLAVAGNVAQAYVQARGLLAQMTLLDAGIDNALALERVANARFELGEVTRLDVESTAAQRAALQAQRGDLDAAIAETTFAIDTLTDRPPGSTRAMLGDASDVPRASPSIPLGQPVDLLRRRPDVIAAAAELDASERNALASRRDLFPKLAVNASYGRSGLALGDAISSASTLRSAAAQLTFPWLDFGATRAAIDEADAQADAGFVGLRQAIAAALEEVEIANAQRHARQRQLERRDDALARGEEALRMARRSYEVGISDLDAVLQAQEGALQARRDRLETEVALATAQIALYSALGGGWQADPAAPGGLEAVGRELLDAPVPDRIRQPESGA
ncbi:RND transporter [Lysobacteraceae bacterium NML93-0399]|nr:RND transporter [Xanthomonadaceae bacterium NML93-0399]